MLDTYGLFTLDLKGGKGVATAFGALLGLNPWMGLTALAIVAVGVIISKRMSVGSILGAVTFPFVAYYFNQISLLWEQY